MTQCRREIAQELMCDGEEVYSLCQGIEFLFTAQCVLESCKSHCQNLQVLTVKEKNVFVCILVSTILMIKHS